MGRPRGVDGGSKPSGVIYPNLNTFCKQGLVRGDRDSITLSLELTTLMKLCYLELPDLGVLEIRMQSRIAIPAGQEDAKSSVLCVATERKEKCVIAQ